MTDREQWRQDLQVSLVRNTGNGPTVESEEGYLYAKYGEPNENGVYGAPDEKAENE